jgi:hypothetical protein
MPCHALTVPVTAQPQPKVCTLFPGCRSAACPQQPPLQCSACFHSSNAAGAAAATTKELGQCAVCGHRKAAMHINPIATEPRQRMHRPPTAAWWQRAGALQEPPRRRTHDVLVRHVVLAHNLLQRGLLRLNGGLGCAGIVLWVQAQGSTLICCLVSTGLAGAQSPDMTASAALCHVHLKD